MSTMSNWCERQEELPASFWHDPLMYQGGSDEFLGARDDISLVNEDWGCDLEAEIVVVTGDVPRAVSAQDALSYIRLVGLVNDVSLRNLIPAELEKGFGFVQSKPASALSPVFVTPDSLGDFWRDGKLHRALMVDLNDAPLGRAVASDDCTFDFGVLIAHLAKTRNLGAGSIIGSGTVSNRDIDGGPGKPVAQGGLGYSCIAEVRMVEKILTGEMATPFLKDGDAIRIEVRDDAGHSIFGAIEQVVRLQ
jgi:fumarylacetoacetate (FAA) hydrolase